MLEQDGDQLDCGTCEIAQAQRLLDLDNAEAWRVFNLVGRRVCQEWRLSGIVLNKVLEPLNTDDATELVERLDIIMAELLPPAAAES